MEHITVTKWHHNMQSNSHLIFPSIWDLLWGQDTAKHLNNAMKIKCLIAQLTFFTHYFGNIQLQSSYDWLVVWHKPLWTVVLNEQFHFYMQCFPETGSVVYPLCTQNHSDVNWNLGCIKKCRTEPSIFPYTFSVYYSQNMHINIYNWLFSLTTFSRVVWDIKIIFSV